ncbi:MAG: hypothetical protein JRJ62_01550 [Deltaproteobacteria bacterium]|nr:hypothetical protein [Deltaproteobacteria bacterium]
MANFCPLIRKNCDKKCVAFEERSRILDKPRKRITIGYCTHFRVNLFSKKELWYRCKKCGTEGFHDDLKDFNFKRSICKSCLDAKDSAENDPIVNEIEVLEKTVANKQEERKQLEAEIKAET